MNTANQERLEKLIKTRAEQIYRRFNTSVPTALKQAEHDIVEAMYVCEFLKQNRSYLKFDHPVDITSPEFEIALSIVCGIYDGWNVDKIADETVVLAR